MFPAQRMCNMPQVVSRTLCVCFRIWVINIVAPHITFSDSGAKVLGGGRLESWVEANAARPLLGPIPRWAMGGV